MIEGYRNCRLCPHQCGVDRTRSQKGICGESDEMRIAFAGIHRGEEPVISVQDDRFRGSGTIFFSGCTLGCRDCQNIQISRRKDPVGRVVSADEFTQICLDLQSAGAANINLVTGTQFIPSIIEGLHLAKERGLSIPIVWNTSSFESEEGMSLLMPVIDIFLADLKTLDDHTCSLFCTAGSYTTSAPEAILQMAADKSLRFDGDQMIEGLVFRHLVIPGAMGNTREVLSWYARNIMGKSILSVMVQYMPIGERPASGRATTDEEYDELLEILEEAGIEDGFLQELGSEDPWIPDFTRRNPFPESFCDPVWHHME